MARPIITPIETKSKRPVITPIAGANSSMNGSFTPFNPPKEKKEYKKYEFEMPKEREILTNKKDYENITRPTFDPSRKNPLTLEGTIDTIGGALSKPAEGFLRFVEGGVDEARVRVGNLAGALGAKNFENMMYRDSAQDTTSILMAPSKKLYDKSAIKEGGLVEGVLQGVGQVAGAFGSTGLGINPFLASGISAAGSAEQEALKSGASKGKAALYGGGVGAIAGTVDKLSGGIGGVLGKGAIDDIIIDRMVKKVSSNSGKFVTNALIKAGFEGVEENIEGAIDPILKRMTYDKNAQSYFKDDNGNFTLTKAGQDFLVGSLTSMLVQAPGTFNNVSSGKKFDKGVPVRPIIEPIKPAGQVATPIETAVEQKKPTPKISERIEETRGLLNSETGKNIIKNAKSNKTSYSNDIYRNVEAVFGVNAEPIKKNILEPFDNSKLEYTNFLKTKTSDLKTKIDTWGIKKGSKDSALIQKFGEKKITLNQLKSATKNWKNVVEADKYFRQQYDTLIDEINASRQQIYPNVEKNIEQTKKDIEKINQTLELKKQELKLAKRDSKKYSNLENQISNLEFRKDAKNKALDNDDFLKGKRIPKRADYYRHFEEMLGGSNGLIALANIITSPNDISSSLAGTSDFTKPLKKFSSIEQQRKGDKTKYDAIGGFLNYLPSAAYAINIDPQIKVFREFGKTLAEQTSDNPSMNKFIEYLNDYSNDLAGKTNPADRFLQKVISRKGMAIMNNISGRIKANAVLGNIGSSISQVLNLPNGIADVGNPIYLTKGLKDTFAKALTKGDNYSESQFISERFLDIDSQFDTKIIDQPKKLAKWMLTALDEASTKFIWNSEYNKAVDKGIENPVSYADNQTRKMVAGRGIGEMTLTQKSKVISTLMPFTVEVGNSLRVMKDFAKEGRVDKLLILFIMSFLINKAVEETGAGGKTFDPIQAVIDATTEQDTNLAQKLGRVGGEIIGAIPGGQQLASLYPEYGATVGDTKTMTRKELFGKNDPTRFGTGNIFSRALEDPITSLATPFGGAQIKKTTRGIKSLTAEVPGGYSKSGKLQYPIEVTPSNIAKGTLFGNFDETKEFYDKERKGLSEKQVEELKNSSNIKKSYDATIKVREYNKLTRKYDELKKDGKSTVEIERKIRNFK